MKTDPVLSRSLRHLPAVSAVLVLLMLMIAAPAFAGPPIGIGVGGVNDYSGEVVFADAMKQSRQWDTTNLDANGWPQQDAGIYVWADTAANFDTSGTYALSFEGQADVSGATVTGKTYDPATNVTTGTITLGPTSTLLLTFTNTRRAPDEALNTGVANVKLMRPTSVGASTSYDAGTTFTTQAKALYAKFGVLRFMDWLATNSNPSVNWSDRTRPEWATQFRWNGPIWSSRPMGSAWEYAVQLCNETGTDMWINIPVGATDDYITKVAQLIAYGSDGTLPYTSGQANPVYAPLAAGHKVYIEFSNEVWNTASAFAQSGTNKDAAVAEVNAGNSPLNFDGATGEWDWAARRSAKRTVEISDIFRSVFGDGAMMTRIRPVLESQQGYTGWWIYQQSRMMEDYYNNAARVPTPHPPGYYVYGGGGSAYYGPENGDDTLTLDSIWTSGTNDVAAWTPICRAESAYALALYGRRVAYEGGPSMDSCGCAGDAAKAAAWSDARMTTSVTDHHTTWLQTGGDLLVYYTAVHDYQWGFTRNVYTLDTPKLQAVDQIDASTPAVGTTGTPIPGTITGGSFAAPETWGVNQSALSADGATGSTWLSYLVRNSTAGQYSIALSAGSVGAGNEADIYVDGAFLGTIVVPGTGANTTAATTTAVTIADLPAGTHGLKVKARAGTFGVQSILVTSGSVADLPGAPGQLAAVAADGKVTLSWSAAASAASYNIYRGTAAGGEDATPLATGVTTNSFADTSVTNGTTYFYVVAAVNDHGTGPQSNEISARPAPAGIGPQVITSIKFYPRQGDWAWRMSGGRFEASNDFVNWTTLASLADVWPPNDTWTTLPVTDTTAWRYVRFVSSSVDTWDVLNVAEIEFYHGTTKLVGTAFGSPGSYQNDPATTFDKAFDGDITTFVDNVGGSFTGLDFGAGSGAGGGSQNGIGPQVITSIRFYPRPGDFGWRMQGGRFEASNDNQTWTTLVSLVDVWPPNDTWTTLPVTDTTAWRYVRFVSVNVNPWEALNVAEIEFYHGATKLIGTAFGSPGSYQNDPATTFDKAFDGDITTFVDNVPGAFVGYDFGEGGGGEPPGGIGPQVITLIKFYPRQGDWAWRMQGGRFEGSNDYVTWTTLVSLVDVWPLNDTWTTLPVTNTAAWRYVRFVNSDVNPWEAFNVAELEFYHGTTKLVGIAFGSAGSYQDDPATTFDKAFDGDITTFVDNVPGTFAGYDFGAGSGSGTPPPATPAGLAAEAGDAQVSLSWGASDGATGYDVKRASAESGPFATLGNVAATAFTDTGLTNGTTYYYVVAATNAGGSSANSAPVSATPVHPDVTPTITSSPASKAATVGDTVSFTVQADGYPAPTYQWRRNGTPIQGNSSATTPTLTLAEVTSIDAGNYDVVVTNVAGTAQSDAAVLTINKAAAVVLLSNVEQRYDGTPRAVAVATIPAGLPVVVTYSGAPAAPVYPGAYTVVAMIDDPDFTGSAEDVLLVTSTALVRHAPVLNGRLDGSAQVLLPESTTLNGSAQISGDLLIAGLPAVQLNGHPTYAGTIDATGAAAPTSHKVTLNGGSALRHVVRRIDAIAMPVIAAPPAPAGTRNVTLNRASDSSGDFATLRSLTLNGNAGVRTIPPGTYDTFTANGNSGFVLGVAGAVLPAVYNLQNLTLNGNTQVQLAGPVILNLKATLTLNGSIGSTAHPEWLELKVAAGGVTLNGHVSLSGAVAAPNGTVIINGNSTLVGGVTADRLTINSNGLLQDGPAPGGLPGAAGALQVVAGHGEVTLSWGAADGATSYQLYRSTHANGLGAVPIAADVTGTSYTDATVVNNTTYYYWLVAVNAYGAGPLAGGAAVTPTPRPTIIGSNFWNKNWGTGPSDYFRSGVDWSTVTNPWRDDFIAQVSVYSVLRFMDWVPTNSSTVRTWSERVQKTDDHYTSPGVAYEWQIDLCNRVGADLWINVPHLTIEDYEANPADNYWTHLARLIKDNLNPNLNVWLEYSNESWSGGADFNQGDYTGQRGVAMGFDTDAYSAKFKFHVYAATRLDKVFLDVFAGQEYRIKKVIAGQANSLWDDDKNWGAYMSITALNDPAINVFGIVPDYYAVTSYVGGDLDGGSPNIVSEWNASLQTTTALAQRVKATFAQYYPTKPNLPLVAYEGGSSITTNSQLFRQNPLSYDMYKSWLNSTEGVFDVVLHYTHVGLWNNGGAWGAKSTTDQPLQDAHSYRAIIDYIETGN